MDEKSIWNQLPEGFTARPATIDDAEAVTELLNICSMETTGAPSWDLTELRSDWTSPGFELARDVRVILNAEGKIIGYVDVWDESPHVHLYALGQVHPDYKGKTLGSAMCQWHNWRGRQSLAKAPAEARVIMSQSLTSTDTVSRALLEANGYHLERFFSRMIIEMEQAPPEAAVPAGITLRPYVPDQELMNIINTMRDSFRDHWGYVEGPLEENVKEWTHWINNDPDHDPSLWFVATENGETAGAAVCRPRTAEDPDMGWVDMLAVRRPWRRRGLGLGFLHHVFGEFYRRGIHKVGLGVDADSLTGATRLYEKAGMRIYRQQAVYHKELRPGTDLSTQSLQE